ncbi:Pentatricopeptide repeat-containing protein [Porphyridium purpureum]|uniref:Pentatricopeptide repeat-containing protein n=1 Tax=Porphyridium purpureum TaxID=35688 RepID=A0A5J4YWU9_PORPP|nr:Pentatricopeptide repeat-containing protein [Porphyridium purpureum]|eukprot:POR4322..scf209_3
MTSTRVREYERTRICPSSPTVQTLISSFSFELRARRLICANLDEEGTRAMLVPSDYGAAFVGPAGTACGTCGAGQKLVARSSRVSHGEERPNCFLWARDKRHAFLKTSRCGRRVVVAVSATSENQEERAGPVPTTSSLRIDRRTHRNPFWKENNKFLAAAYNQSACAGLLDCLLAMDEDEILSSQNLEHAVKLCLSSRPGSEGIAEVAELIREMPCSRSTADDKTIGLVLVDSLVFYVIRDGLSLDTRTLALVHKCISVDVKLLEERQVVARLIYETDETESFGNLADRALDLLRASCAIPEWALVKILRHVPGRRGLQMLLEYEFRGEFGLGVEHANAVLSSCSKDADKKTAAAVLEFLDRREIPRDSETSKALLRVFIRAGDLSKARSVLSEAHEAGHATTIMYNMIMDALTSGNRRHREAVDVFNQMLQHGIEPDKVSFTIAIKSFIGMGNLPGVLRIYDAVCERVELADAQFYRTVVGACLRSYDVETARRVVGDMEARGWHAGERIWCWLLEEAARKENSETACAIAEDMVHRRVALLPAEKARLMQMCRDRGGIDMLRLLSSIQKVGT